jgi:hypothetical protein
MYLSEAIRLFGDQVIDDQFKPAQAWAKHFLGILKKNWPLRIEAAGTSLRQAQELLAGAESYLSSESGQYVPAGQAYSGAAPTISPVTVYINGTAITPSFAGITEASLYQLNVTIPSGLPTGDVSLQAAVSGSQTPSGTVISLQ